MGRQLEQIKRVMNRRDTDELPSYAWPGGYPLFYITKRNAVLCPGEHCAQQEDPEDPIVATEVNYENPHLYCDACGECIESAYAEKDAHEAA